MIDLNLIKSLAIRQESKIVFLIIDGLGGLPKEGKTELETAITPNFDKLVSKSSAGLLDPIAPGITPGSGPAHLALFGYDPLKYQIGRGVLAALGIGFSLKHNDLAARINFATVNKEGKITDRRAGRISTAENSKLCKLLQKIKIPGVEISVEPVKEHRAVVIFRGDNLSDDLSDSDPQKTDVLPKKVEPLNKKESAKYTAQLANNFIKQATQILSDYHPANAILLRGFAKHVEFPRMEEIYLLKPAAIAVYPMYKGLARLMGMEILSTGVTIKEEFSTLKNNFEKYDFFYLHIKGTDSAGEDGDFARKVKIIEEVDRYLPELINLKPEVIVITGDHSTPAIFKAHSWHPVPILLYSKWVRTSNIKKFSERDCSKGSLGRLPATSIMPLSLANAGKLKKYGA